MMARRMVGHKFGVHFLVFLSCLAHIVYSTAQDKKEEEEDERWKKKDIRDYSDADLERLYDQWEEDDDPLEEDELPEWKRPPPKIDLTQLNTKDPESLLQQTKKGRTLMMFATVSGDPTEQETEDITRLWQSSLFNANYEVQRYIVASNRALFMLKDGAKAWEIKNFIVTQDRCEFVTVEGKDYHGKGSSKYGESVEDNSTKKPRKKSKKTKSGQNDIKVEL